MATAALVGIGVALAADRVGSHARARAVVRPDQDAITLAVDASARALPAGLDRVGALILVTTTPPYVEGGSVQVLAELLNLHGEVVTVELGSSPRDALTALRLATALVAAHGTVLVCASHASPADSSTGDGAVALLLADPSTKLPARRLGNVTPLASYATELRDRWRLPNDRTVRMADSSFVDAIGTTNLVERLVSLLPDDHAPISVTGPHARASAAAERSRGGPGDPSIGATGVLGAAHPLLRLVAGLAAPQVVTSLAGGVGEAVEVTPSEHGPEAAAEVLKAIAAVSTEPASTYSYAAAPGFVPYASVPRSWRERDTDLRLRGILADDAPAPGRVKPTGTVLTHTRDHVYPAHEPIEVVAVTLDAGGQFFGQVAVGEHVAIGDRVELVVRRLHDGNGIVQYFWKAQPCR